VRAVSCAQRVRVALGAFLFETAVSQH
jgi:hypothetical protein